MNNNMNKENLIKRVEENFDDMKKTLIEHSAAYLIPLFRDYTDEIIKVIEKEENGNGKEEEKEFNQEKCDWRYMASCVADTNCTDDCDMKCPYTERSKQ